jgi:hypothetical protein
VFVGTLEKLQ